MINVDVLGIGCAAIDDTVYVSGSPPSDGKTRVLGTSRDFGGLTATALVAAARLGATCRYAGMLGRDPGSLAVVGDLRGAGVIVSRHSIFSEARPIRSIIISSRDSGSRAIYFDDPILAGAPADISANVVKHARVLLLDGYGITGSIRAAQIARQLAIPIVGDLERADDAQSQTLLSLIDHLVLPLDFARQITKVPAIDALLTALWNSTRKLVAVTDGANGCWVKVPDVPEVMHVPAYQVTAVDTTGCGDVFHGAYAAALAFGYPSLHAVRFASVAAALKATQSGTRKALPGRPEVESRLSVWM
jgi:sulfofructose kinase